jgi:HEAT repeat protein
MDRKRNVKGLVKALKYKDPKVRENATEALGNIGNGRAVEPLISALRGKPWKCARLRHGRSAR